MINLLDEKSICSPVYFNQYFLYTPSDDIISDIEFDRLIEDIATMSQDELTERFEFYYQKYGYDELKRVIDQILYRKYFNNISNDCIGLICVALSRLSVNKAKHKYNDPEIGLKFTQRFINPENRIQFTPGYIDPEIGIQVELTICNILNRYVVNDEKRRDGSIIPDYEKQVDIIKTIFSEQELLPFHLFLAAHICEKCSVYNVEKEKVNSLVYDLINRYIDQNSIGAMFKLELTPTTVLFKIWKEMDPTGYREQIEQYTDSDEFDAVPFIQKMIYNSDINYYNRFCELFNANKMYEKVKNVVHDQIYDFTHTIGYFIRMHDEKSMSPGENSMTPGENSMTPGEKSISSGKNAPV